MNWRATLEGELVPAKVLSLIRDGKATNISEVCDMLGINDRIPLSIAHLARQRLEVIVDSLTDAGLVSKNAEKIAPTGLIAKIQNSLQISLTELSEMSHRAKSGDFFVQPSVIEELKRCNSKNYDLAKVVRFCEELNSSFSSGSNLASTLLIRALLNHIPPIFGHSTFPQVVSQSGRSLKAVLSKLEEDSRAIADMHTHLVIRQKESLPTRNQVEPFKANLEVLLNEIVAKAQDQT